MDRLDFHPPGYVYGILEVLNLVQRIGFERLVCLVIWMLFLLVSLGIGYILLASLMEGIFGMIERVT